MMITYRLIYILLDFKLSYNFIVGIGLSSTRQTSHHYNYYDAGRDVMMMLMGAGSIAEMVNAIERWQ
jgi:hypothetical protein